jgi:fatty-acyl-CoA synthase
VGLLTSGVETRLDDDELLLKADTVMSGYYNLPEENAECLQDGGYRTADLAEQDADGYFSISGRRSEMIRSGGEQLSRRRLKASFSVSKAGWRSPSSDYRIRPGVELSAPRGVRTGQLSHLGRNVAYRLANVASFKHPRRWFRSNKFPARLPSAK